MFRSNWYSNETATEDDIIRDYDKQDTEILGGTEEQKSITKRRNEAKSLSDLNLKSVYVMATSLRAG
jgi:hypothetical protein